MGEGTERRANGGTDANEPNPWLPAVLHGASGELRIEDRRVVFRRDGHEGQSFGFERIKYFRVFTSTGTKVTGFYVVALKLEESTYGVLQLGLHDRVKVYFIVHPADIWSIAMDLRSSGLKQRGGGHLPRSKRPGR